MTHCRKNECIQSYTFQKDKTLDEKKAKSDGSSFTAIRTWNQKTPHVVEKKRQHHNTSADKTGDKKTGEGFTNFCKDKSLLKLKKWSTNKIHHFSLILIEEEKGESEGQYHIPQTTFHFHEKTW